MEEFQFVDIDTAITQLERIKNEDKNVVVFIINFDKNTSEKIIANYDESCNIIRNGATIAYNHDDYISHIEVFSVLQRDRKHILPVGIMHDILIGKE